MDKFKTNIWYGIHQGKRKNQEDYIKIHTFTNTESIFNNWNSYFVIDGHGTNDFGRTAAIIVGSRINALLTEFSLKINKSNNMSDIDIIKKIIKTTFCQLDYDLISKCPMGGVVITGFLISPENTIISINLGDCTGLVEIDNIQTFVTKNHNLQSDSEVYRIQKAVLAIKGKLDDYISTSPRYKAKLAVTRALGDRSLKLCNVSRYIDPLSPIPDIHIIKSATNLNYNCIKLILTSDGITDIFPISNVVNELQLYDDKDLNYLLPKTINKNQSSGNCRFIMNINKVTETVSIIDFFNDIFYDNATLVYIKIYRV